MALVVDASVMLRWYFDDEDEVSVELLRSLAAESIVVPKHWRAELANGVVMGERRGRAPVAQVSRLFSLVGSLDLEVDGEGAEDALERILPLARAHRLTVYDAMYLELAGRRGLPLATFDRLLADAAKSVGCHVLSGGSTL